MQVSLKMYIDLCSEALQQAYITVLNVNTQTAVTEHKPAWASFDLGCDGRMLK